MPPLVKAAGVHVKAAFAALVIGFAMVPLAAGAQAADVNSRTRLEKAYAAFDKAASDAFEDADRPAMVARMYAADFSTLQTPGQLKNLSSRELGALFNAADTAAFYAPSRRYVADMALDLEALESRGAATSDERDAYYGAIFQIRDFSGMSTYFEKHRSSSLGRPIDLKASAAPPGLHVVLAVVDHDTLSRIPVDLGQGFHIVVVSHPDCHFTQNAVKAISKSADLRQLFNEKSTWVAPPGRDVDLKDFVEWNKEHASTPIAIADAKSGWPEVDIWQTPTFLYFKNGKVVARVIGWPKEGNEKALRDAIAKTASR
jgi:hypothetical protein